MADRTPPGSSAPAVIQLAALLRDPVGEMRRRRDRYGPVFQIKFPGYPGVVYVADAALAHRIFASDRDIGRAGEARREFLEPLVGAHSLLTLDGEAWTRQRKLHGSAFHGRRLQGYRDRIAEIAARHVRDWPTGRPFALRPRTQAITLEVIVRIVFGISDDVRVRRLRELLPPLIDTAEGMQTVLMAAPTKLRGPAEALMARVPGSGTARFRTLRAATDAILYEEIRRRRREGDDAHDDLLAGLMSEPVGDEELRDALMTLLVAGHETTATALAWCFERLVRHPEVADRLTASLRAGEHDYLDAVIKESLRTRPIVVDMPRILTEPMTLGGYMIPAGWMVSPFAPLIHESADAFPGPEEFRPERFLDGDVPSQAWIPFGGGRRACLGGQFALLEMAAIIPEILSRLRIGPPEAAEDERARVRNVTLAPDRDAQVVAHAE